MIVVHFIPDVFEQDHLSEGSGQRDQLLDFLAGSLVNFGRGTVLAMSNDDQNSAATGRVRNSQAVLDVLAARRSLFLFRTSQSLTPVRVIDRIVDKHSRFTHSITSLLRGERTCFIEVDPVKARLSSQLQPLGQSQVLAINLLRNHPQLARQQDSLACRWDDNGTAGSFRRLCRRSGSSTGGSQSCTGCEERTTTDFGLSVCHEEIP